MALPQIRRAPAMRGWQWVVRSIEIFARSPVTWIALNLMLLCIASVLTYIPVVGGLLFALLTPVFAGGLTLGCSDVHAGRPLLPAHLFAGFRRNAGALVSIGGVYVVGQIAIFGLLTTVGGPQLQAMMQTAFGDQSGALPPAVSDRVVAAILLAGALFVPLAMAVWFAPVLAVLHELPARQAIKLSLQGSLRNLPAMAIYSLAMGALLVGLLFVVRILVAFVPKNLTAVRDPIALLVMTFWISQTLISAYIGYRDIFTAEVPRG
jgi:hypothetical protein